MKYLLAFVPAALIALCFAGYAAAQSPPAAPTGVTVLSSGEGVVIIWDENDMATHWIAWMNRGEYESARAAGEWTAALNYAYVFGELLGLTDGDIAELEAAGVIY